jgi:hypothetical protein
LGSKGQEIVDDRVWVVSTNHPALMPEAPIMPTLPTFGVLKFESSKVICVVRNPLDALMDLAKSLNPITEEFEAEWWNWFVTE